jgi:precorrin-2 dehydrogenase / sirohydrochlorin ferrochelatase
MKKTGKSNSYYPAFLDLKGKKCILAGGGQVALRKVQSLLDCGADIMVIGSRLCAGMDALADAGRLSVMRRKYQEGDIKGAFVVIAATGDHALNRSIAREARQNRVLVNVVDDPANCDFIVPSILRRGDVAIAVSTGGKSPALARKLRSRLEEQFGEEFGKLADLVSEVREEMKTAGLKVDAEQWQKALDLDSLAELVNKGSMEQARALLKQKLTGPIKK